MSINILDSMIINRISAGEVVESPFSIVKELLDNSLDAGADKIFISIKNGGIDQIIVKDNGKGIEKDDIVKAFLPHATSKIKNIEDLENILTLGFRGEALASISNVSQTVLVTKRADAEVAYTINVDGGKFSSIEATTSENGTKIEVNNLFYNTPARKKFLKKPKIEEGQITNIVARYILCHPEVSFKYVVDDKTVYQTKGSNLIDAISCVYNNETTQNIMPISKAFGNIKLSGYVSKVGYSKPNTTYQTLILNSRYVIDEIVSKAVYKAFEEYLMPRQFPFYVLKLEMPTNEVDVNVHPSKMNVKFSNPGKIFDLVYTATRAAIYEMINPINENDLVKENLVSNIEEKLVKTEINSLKEIEIEPTIPNFDTKITLRQESYSPVTMFDLVKETNNTEINKNVNPENTIRIEAKDDAIQPTQEKEFKNIEEVVDFKIIGQIFNEFIIIERGENMIIIDFHAGHERLNYDKFSNMVRSRNIVVQDLLIPYTQEMTIQEVNYILTLKNELKDLGFDVDSFGDNKIIINSVPMQLKDINLKNFVDDLLHDIKNIKPTMNNEITHYLMQKACKSSVRSGMTLSEMEIRDLIKNLDIKNPVLLCPHGRPVLTVIPKSQIEKWFKRIV